MRYVDQLSHENLINLAVCSRKLYSRLECFFKMVINYWFYDGKTFNGLESFVDDNSCPSPDALLPHLHSLGRNHSHDADSVKNRSGLLYTLSNLSATDRTSIYLTEDLPKGGLFSFR